MGRVEEYNMPAMVSFARRNVAMFTSVGAMVVTLLLNHLFWRMGRGGQHRGRHWQRANYRHIRVHFRIRADSVNVGDGRSQCCPTTGHGCNPRGRVQPGTTASDTWWGKAFLTACPLH